MRFSFALPLFSFIILSLFRSSRRYLSKVMRRLSNYKIAIFIIKRLIDFRSQLFRDETRAIHFSRLSRKLKIRRIVFRNVNAKRTSFSFNLGFIIIQSLVKFLQTKRRKVLFINSIIPFLFNLN